MRFEVAGEVLADVNEVHARSIPVKMVRAGAFYTVVQYTRLYPRCHEQKGESIASKIDSKD